VELSPETCRVKPLRRINAIVASSWNYFTTTDLDIIGVELPVTITQTLVLSAWNFRLQ